MKSNIKTLQIPGIIGISLILLSCHKNLQNPAGNHLLEVLTDRTIKIKQAVVIFDSTAIKDSIDFVNPPASRTYQWKINPQEAAATFSGHYKNGLAEIIFGRSGTFQVSADIYDSLGLRLTGHTNAVKITVVDDTLYPTQAIQPGDGLNINSTVAGTISNGQAIYTELQLIANSAKSYEYASPYGQFEITATGNNGGYSFVFSDSILLSSYPIAYGLGVEQPVAGVLDMQNMPDGTPVSFSITWLDKVYSGTVTLARSGAYSYSWDNSGPIKIR